MAAHTRRGWSAWAPDVSLPVKTRVKCRDENHTIVFNGRQLVLTNHPNVRAELDLYRFGYTCRCVDILILWRRAFHAAKAVYFGAANAARWDVKEEPGSRGLPQKLDRLVAAIRPVTARRSVAKTNRPARKDKAVSDFGEIVMNVHAAFHQCSYAPPSDRVVVGVARPPHAVGAYGDVRHWDKLSADPCTLMVGSAWMRRVLHRGIAVVNDRLVLDAYDPADLTWAELSGKRLMWWYPFASASGLSFNATDRLLAIMAVLNGSSLATRKALLVKSRGDDWSAYPLDDFSLAPVTLPRRPLPAR